jgi:hypothetical protein
VASIAIIHQHEAQAIEFLKPACVKRKRHHTFAKGFSWGGFNAVHDAALAADSSNLLSACQLCRVPVSLMMAVYRQPVFVGGRYLKLKRNVSQSPWFEDEGGGRVGMSSVQVCSMTLCLQPRSCWHTDTCSMVTVS